MKKWAYYNENDPNAAAWIRELIKRGLVAPGEVDDRSILDVRPDDVRGFAQAHWFAGVAVWSHALRLAGWADDRPIWTGSCPCQPFSAAGKGGGFDDERHLWPAFHHLIEQCRPDVVVGEQVASKDGLAWLDLVHADLEGTGYAVGAVDTCAAGFGAPHIRQRLWWVGERLADAPVRGRLERRAEPDGRGAAGGCSAVDLADRDGFGQRSWTGLGLQDTQHHAEPCGRDDRLADAQGHGHERRRELDQPTGRDGAAHGEHDRGLADADGGNASAEGLQRGGQHGQQQEDAGCRVLGLHPADTAHDHADLTPTAHHPDRLADDDRDGAQQTLPGIHLGRPQSDGGPVRTGPTNGFWAAPDWLQCRDGKWRAVEPGTFPLAHGSAARVGRLRGYGNAIVAQAAQGFIASVMEAVQ